ncbi:MAG: PsbP-related protein [Bacteroidota bacterium]
MKKALTLVFSIFILTLALTSCGKKGDATEITGLTAYSDPTIEFSMKYPTNWYSQTVPGTRFICFTKKEAKDRFIQYDPNGNTGAKIEVLFQKLEEGITLDTIIKKTKLFNPENYKAPVKVKLDGVDAVKIAYSFPLEDGEFNGEAYFATKDNKYATTIIFEAFAGTMEEYHKKFEEMIASVKLAVAPKEKGTDTIQVQVEAEPASKVMMSKGGDGFSIDIPDNFRAEGSKAAGTISSRNFIGARRADCNIQVDVIDASKQKNLKKIVEENVPKYKNAKPVETKLGGQPAYVMNYSFGRNVMSRVYFVIKGERLYRMTVNWFKGEEKDYLPIFENSIKSFKFQ